MGSGRGMGADILLNEHIVLVTINYRLGPFGFLNLDSADGYSGNMGLKDQLLALKWVRNNIRAFGGDPELVTLYGHSAGAVAIHMHILSATSRPYFKRAIMSGASAYVPWAYGHVNHSQMMAEMISKATGVATDTIHMSDIVEWLRNVDMNSFGMETLRPFFIGGHQRKKIDFTWMPVVEGMTEFSSHSLIKSENSISFLRFQFRWWLFGSLFHQIGVWICAGTQRRRYNVQFHRCGEFTIRWGRSKRAPYLEGIRWAFWAAAAFGRFALQHVIRRVSVVCEGNPTILFRKQIHRSQYAARIRQTTIGLVLHLWHSTGCWDTSGKVQRKNILIQVCDYVILKNIVVCSEFRNIFSGLPVIWNWISSENLQMALRLTFPELRTPKKCAMYSAYPRWKI